MKEALIVAMHDSKNMVYVEGRSNKELATTYIAPGYRTISVGVTIECGWHAWGNILTMIITKADGKTFSIDYRGSYTVVFAPEPPAQEPEGVSFEEAVEDA